MFYRKPHEQNLSSEQLQARKEAEHVKKQNNATEDTKITGIDIPFGDLVTLFTRSIFALIPAAIVVAIVVYFVIAILTSF